MSKQDHFPLRISRALVASDEYAELTDRERAVYFTVAALSFDALTFKKLARLMNSKIESAIGRLTEKGFVEVSGEAITLSKRWAFVDLSTSRVTAKRERDRAAKVVAAVAPGNAEQQPLPAPMPAATSPLAPPPTEVKWDVVEESPPASAYVDDWDCEDPSEEMGVDLTGLTASIDFVLDAPAAPSHAAPAPVATAPVAEPSKAARKRAAAAAQADVVESIELPAYLPRETWMAFIEHRRFIKAPLNLAAAKLIITEAAKLYADRHDVVQAFNKTIASGRWLSINAPQSSGGRGGYPDKASAQRAEGRGRGGLAL